MASVKYLAKSTNSAARKPFTLRYWDEQGQHEKSFVTAAERKGWAVEFEHAARRGTFIDPKLSAVPFATYAAQWVDGLDRRPATVANYRQLIKSHIVPAFAGRTLAQVAIDREGVLAMLAAMKDAGASGSRRALVKAVVTGIVTEAQTSGRIATHRLAGITVTRNAVRPAVVIPATMAQLDKLAAGLRPEYALTVFLMRGCGLRVSEALAVRLDGFRDSGRTLRISEQTGTGGTLGPLKHRDEGAFRDVPVPAWCWARVLAHVDAYGTSDGLAGYLFTRPDGGRVGYDSYIARFRTSAKSAGLPALRPHGLRHLFASSLLTNLVPMSEVSKWLGHANFNITHQTYSHLVPSAFDRAREVLDMAIA